MTIKEIAAKAGVSIATVSHVINHTRYVSPELVDKIEAIIEESGYSEKIKKKVRKIRSGRSSQIVAVFPNIKSALYCDLCNQLQSYATSQGYQFYTAATNDSPEEEKSILQNLISSAKTIGIFLSPASSNPAAYSFLYESGIPFVCVERFIDDDVTPRILFDYTKAFHSATSYFFESGHENVLFLVEKTDSLAKQDKIAGYERALFSANHTLSSSCIAEINLYQSSDTISLNIQKSITRYLPTAIIAGGNRLTMFLLKALRELGKDCPRDISIIGFDDMLWCELTAPPISCIHRDIDQMAELASQALFDEINFDEYDCVVLPGGLPGATNLRADQRVCDVVCKFAATKHVAAICAAPFILGELDLLEGRHATCFPGFEKSFPEGAYTGDKVTHDGNIITASGMAQSLPFALELLRTLAGDKAVEKVAEGIQL